MDIAVNILGDQRWSFAYAGTRRPVVKQVILQQSGAQPTEDIEVFPRVILDFPLPDPVAPVWEGRSRTIEARGLDIGKEITWERIDLDLNYPLLGRLREHVVGRIRVEIIRADSGEVLHEDSSPLTLLAPNEWRFEEPHFEVLAAFVLPSDPFVSEVLTQARQLLHDRTGDSSTEGYQSEAFVPDDPRPIQVRSRAYQIALAVYDAISSVGYAYSNPQGSFDDTSQRVRTPSQIKSEHCATCLDSAVLMAACLAQAGLEPVLFLIDGHAFVGYFTGAPVTNAAGQLVTANGKNPAVGDDAVSHWLYQTGTSLNRESDRALIELLLRNGHIQPVETTTTTNGLAKPFHEACLAQNGFSLDDQSALNSIVIVSNTWKAGITPPVSLAEVPLHDLGALPIGLGRGRSIADNATQGLSDGEPELAETKISAEERAVPPRVRQWMASLLDLSSRNPLLKIKPAQALEFDLPSSALGRLDDLLHAPKAKVELVSPSSLPREWVHQGVTEDDFQQWIAAQVRLVHPSYKQINGIQRSVEHLVRQLRGKPDDPVTGLASAEESFVRRVRANRQDEIHSRSDAQLIQEFREQHLAHFPAVLGTAVTKLQTKAKEVMLSTGNNSLYLALGTMAWSETVQYRGNGKRTDWCAPLYVYPVILEGGKGSPYTIRLDPNGEVSPNYCLHEKLKRPPYNLDLQELVNPDRDGKGLDLDKMLGLIEQRLRQAKLDNFTIEPRAVLGVFDYSTFRLWSDLKSSWKQMCEISPVVTHLVYTPNIPFRSDPNVPSPRLEPHLPIAADDSQREAVQWALDGKSFRLEGPPGTGKSQTITNLLASCIAANKKVLFVAEKQTALNAVKERLDEAGLGKYCLNLHAKGDSDTRLRRNISEALTVALAERVDPADAKWQDLTFRIKNEEAVLNRYRESLHQPPTTGFSAWAANEELLAIGAGPVLDLPDEFVEQFTERWPRLREISAQIEDSFDLVGDPREHMWRLIDGCRVTEGDYQQITFALTSLSDSVTTLRGLGEAWSGVLKEFDYPALSALAAGVGMYAEGVLQSTNDLVDVDSRVQQFEAYISDCRRVAALVVRHLGSVAAEFVQSNNIDEVRQALEAMAAVERGPALASVIGDWSLLAAEAQSLAMVVPFTVLERRDPTELHEALARYQSADVRQEFARLAREVRSLESKIRPHRPNVSPELFNRPDLLNVKVLFESAAAAGILTKSRKVKALRELLGTEALATDDRLLLLSLGDLLEVSKDVTAIRSSLSAIDSDDIGPNFRPWEPDDLDRLIERVQRRRIDALRSAVGVEAAGQLGSDELFANSLRAMLELAPRVRSAIELLHRHFPEEASHAWKPWRPEEGKHLQASIRAAHLAKLRLALGEYALATADEQLASGAAAWLKVAPSVEELSLRLPASVMPGYRPTFRPWNDDDIASLIRHREAIVSLATDLRVTQATALLGSLLNTQPAKTHADALANFANAWNHLPDVFETTPESLHRWRGARTFIEALDADLPKMLRDGGANHRYLELTRWLALMAALNQLGTVGLGRLRNPVMTLELGVESLLSQTRRSALQQALRARFQEGNLDRFDRKVHERRIATFEASLKEAQSLLSQRIPGLVNSRRRSRALPTGNDVGATQALLRGLKPVRGERTPIRNLIDEYGNALAEVMPCFLMSPDSVATLVPVGAIDFDLVVFDEASQVRTAHAMGALGRGAAGIVVGDSRQMPPSTAFSSNAGAYVEDDDDDTDAVIQDDNDDIVDSGEVAMRPSAARDAESILTEFYEAELPHLQLLCHYRSKDEVLIAFSNTNIYETPMLTFPSILGMESTALRFVHVPDGRYERDATSPPIVFKETQVTLRSLRTNLREAEAVMAETLTRLRDPERQSRRTADSESKAESIIIVTFNIQQMNLITEMLRAADQPLFDSATTEGEADEATGKRTAPQLKIRNLENVQGDEAETVIFSVAFSKTPSGKLPLNFGPVTQAGGDRRLNVAVTRAQREMIVFCSFLPKEMSEANRSISAEARMVQSFLDLAHRGPSRSGDVGIEVPRSHQIDEIARSLRARGYRTQTQLGMSTLRVDIAVSRPGSTAWELAIMVDDVCWAERGSAFQREVLPRQILPGLGWRRVLRIWTPAWINDREEILRDIDSFFAGVPAEDQHSETPEIGSVVSGSSAVSDMLETVTGPAAALPTATQSTPIATAGSGDRPRLQLRPLEQKEEPHRLYAAFEVKQLGDKCLLDEAPSNAVSKLRVLEIVSQVLRAEAPVEAERLAKLVCNCLGLGRVSAERVEQVLSLIPKEQFVKDHLGTFVWLPEQNRAPWVTYRSSLGEAVRTPGQICMKEYVNALRDFVERSDVLDHDAAVREVALIFGFKSVNSNIKASVLPSFEHAVTHGVVVLSDGKYRLP